MNIKHKTPYLLNISHSSVFYNSAILSVSGLALQVLGFLYRIIQSRMVGAEGLGILSLIFPVYSIINAVTLSGICMAVNHLSAEAWAIGDKSALRVIFSKGAYIFCIIYSAMAIPVFFFAEKLSFLLIGSAAGSRAIRLFLPCIFLTAFENLCKNIFHGIRRISRPVLSEIAEQMIRISAVFLLLFFIKPKSPVNATELIVLGMTVSEVFSSSFMLASLASFLRKNTKKDNGRKSIPGKIIRTAIPVSFSSLCGNLITSFITVALPQRLILAGYAENAAVSALGTLSAMAMPLMYLPLSLIYPIITAAVPKITGSHALSDDTDVQRKSAKLAEIAAMIILPISAIAVPLSPRLAELFFGGSLEEEIMLMLALSAISGAYQSVASGIMNGIGKHRIAMAANLFGGIIHFVIMWGLSVIPGVGLYGYIVGSAVGSGFAASANFVYLRLRQGIHMPLYRVLIRPLAAAIVCGLSTRLIFLYSGSGVISLLPSATIGIALCVVIYKLYGYAPINYLKTLVPKYITTKEKKCEEKY